MKSVKTYRTGDAKIDKVLAEIARDMNALSNSVNQPQLPEGFGSAGKGGDIRVMEGDDRRTYLEVKGKYGWYTTCINILQPKGKQRPDFQVVNQSTLLYVAKYAITSADVPDTIVLGTIPSGYTLKNIFGTITTGFGADNTISFTDGSTLLANNVIDITQANTFDYPFFKEYASNTDINIVLAGTGSTGAGVVLLEAVKEAV